MGIPLGFTRRQFLQLCAASPLLLAAATACSSKKTFNLGIYHHPGHEGFYISEYFNLLPDAVTLRKSQSADTMMAAMLAGELDAATLALDEVLTCIAHGIPLKVFSVLSQSCGANALLSKPELANPLALKGKVIALEQRASTELLLQYYLNRAGLQRQDVEVAYLPQLKQLMAWQEGQIDAAINSPPVSHYIERAGAKRLFDDHECTPAMFQVLAVRTDRINWLSDIPARLLNSYYLGLQQLRLFQGDSIRRTALWRNLTLAETERYFASVQQPTPAQNLKLLTESPTLPDVLSQLVQFMPEPQLLLPHITGLFDASALRQLVMTS